MLAMSENFPFCNTLEHLRFLAPQWRIHAALVCAFLHLKVA
jgi:hypothetical protein